MTMDRLIRWAPRVLGISVALFVGVFALDAFAQGLPPGEALVHFAVHVVPALLLLGTVAVSWRHEWVGGVTFIALAIAYATMVSRFDWVLLVSGPLLLTGVLFMASWLYRGGLPRRGPAALRGP